MVYIVGAGPGDPELITVRGLRTLRQAEVVVYDRLIAPELLGEAPAAAERIDAGKARGSQTLSQEAINELLVEHGRQGHVVVRLKGGDPFVFGRGAEEAEALARAGVRFQVIPGVTSAVAVPAAAGIPVTDRRYASSFRVIAGQGTGQNVPFPTPDHRETVVVLMPVGSLPQIVQRLLQEGWPGGTPAALVEQGTTPLQRTVSTTLSGVAQAAEQERIRPPAVLVVGDVVRLREIIAIPR